MNETTKHFFAKLYLEQWINGSDYVDWAFTCLEEGFDSKSLRLLAGQNRNHPFKIDFEELFRKSLEELGWRYLDKRESLLNHAKVIANQILSDEIDYVEAVEKLYKVYVKLGYPAELEMWNLLYDGHSTNWYDRCRWIPFVSTYNNEKWLQNVKLEATDLAKIDFFESQR